MCCAGLLLAALALPVRHFDRWLQVAAMVFALSAVLDGITAQITSYYPAVARCTWKQWSFRSAGSRSS